MEDPFWKAFLGVAVAGVECSPHISDDMLVALRREYQLDWDGLHGFNHWTRVRENGLRLAALTGADAGIAELFAFLHDVGRRNDGWDKEHGRRAVDFLDRIAGRFFCLSPERTELLRYACAHHTDGYCDADITIQVCWDADRLDLGRVRIRPDAKYLCTPQAQHPSVIEWAYQRSRSDPCRRE